MLGGEAYSYLCGVDVNGVEIEVRLPVQGGITYSDSDDESHGKNNKESVRVNRFMSLTNGKDNRGSVGDDFPLDARTFLISRKRSRLFKAHSSGITFILVKGKKSMCVVSRDKSEDMEQFVLDLDDILASYQDCFKEGLEIEPFAAATFFLGAGNVNKPVSRFPGLRKAMVFLRDILRSDLTLTYEKTVQTAISALIYLYAEDLNANEIEVRVVKEGCREKESLEIGEIEEHISHVQGHEHPSILHEGIEKSADGEIEEHISRPQGHEHPSKLHEGTEKSEVINECR